MIESFYKVRMNLSGCINISQTSKINIQLAIRL